MIELKNICFSYGDREVLKDFNLTLNAGECVCLHSPSGGGKTTVFRIIEGLETPQSGTVTAPKKLSVVFQEDRLLKNLSVKQNILLTTKKEHRSYALELVGKFGLAEFMNTPLKNLSGGMKRRVAIIRALGFRGDALLLDEPFNGIDNANKKIIAETIKQDFINLGVPVLISTHILEDASLLGATIKELNIS